MLENLDLTKTVSKESWRAQKDSLQNHLYNLIRSAHEAKIATTVILEGWDTAGKGECIKHLTQRQDPRYFQVHCFTPPRTFEQQFPWLRRFWLRLPNEGELAIFDTSWYRRVLVERVNGQSSEEEVQRAFQEINNTELMLADDGMILLKFWLHIDRKEQKHRFKKLEKDQTMLWRLTETNWESNKEYQEYVNAIEEMLAKTQTEWAPWIIVGATDPYHTRLMVMQTVAEALEHRLQELGKEIIIHRPVDQAAIVVAE